MTRVRSGCPGQMMQHLGPLGTHARPLARSQNDNAQGLCLVLGSVYSHVSPSNPKEASAYDRPFPQSNTAAFLIRRVQPVRELFKPGQDQSFIDGIRIGVSPVGQLGIADVSKVLAV